MTMKLPRRKFLHLAAGAVALPAASHIARAQAYPSRPVRWIVGFPPGGSSDLYARLIGQWLSERLGQQFVIENRVGAGSNIATEAGIRSHPDGYTVFHVTIANAVNATLYDKLNFDLVRDIVPVAGINRAPSVVVVNPAVSANSIPELIAFARVNPGKLNMASGGNGSQQHVFGELFKTMAGVDMVHVPYRGGGPALTDLLAGQVHVMFDTFSTSIEYIKAGKLRVLAVTSPAPWEALPGVPTVAEFVPGYSGIGWQGVAVPKNTPAEIVDKLNKEINAALADPRMKARLADFGGEALVGSPAVFGKVIADDTEKWGKVIRAANIKAE